jgi:hypothetical protein
LVVIGCIPKTKASQTATLALATMAVTWLSLGLKRLLEILKQYFSD